MLNTKRIALAGALALLSTAAAAQTPCTVAPGAAHVVELPEELTGLATKLRTAPVFTPGVHELLALVDTRLILVRDAMSAPRPIVLAENVRDFTTVAQLGGRSRVVVVGDEGLRLSEVVDFANPEEGKTLEFSAIGEDPLWAEVTILEAAGPAGNVHVVGAAESKVSHGLLADNGAFVELETIQVGNSVAFLAVADAHSRAGAEIAVGKSTRIDFFFQSYNVGEPVLPYMSVTAVSDGFTHVKRIPLGADARDSFGLNQRTAATDIFFEVAGTSISDPIYGAHVRVNDVSFAPIGISFNPLVTLQTDLVIASQAGELVALHGTPQGAPGIPFVFDFAQFTAVQISSLIEGGSVADARVACGDLDGDGDGDFAVANNYGGGASFILLRNDCSTREPVGEPVIAVKIDAADEGGGGSWTPYVGVEADLQVRQPPIFNGSAPTHVRVKVYIREYYEGVPGNLQAPVSPETWFDQELDVEPDTSANPPAPFKARLEISPITYLPTSLSAPHAQLDTGNTLVYFELVPLRKDPVTGVVIQRANATVWVASENNALLCELLCASEPDEFSYLYDCTGCLQEDGGHLITEVHRRKVIRPIPPTTVPQ